MNDVLDPTYLPFTEKQLRSHFAPVAGEQRSDPDRHLAYYKAAIERLAAHQQALGRSSPGDIKRARQIEKDERVWIVSALMALYHDQDPAAAFGHLLVAANLAPPGGHEVWQAALRGELHLFFEVGLNSPRAYREYLSARLDERTPIPYVREAAGRVGLRLEGATQVDAVLLAPDTGVRVMFEAKVLSDCSATVTYDVLRNQLARNIDVMLDRQPRLPHPLSSRDPESSCLVLVTPELFRRQPHSRLYGWLMNDYREHPETIGRDLPHRTAAWPDVARRLGWGDLRGRQADSAHSMSVVGSHPGPRHRVRQERAVAAAGTSPHRWRV
jgi:hypothetical protein